MGRKANNLPIRLARKKKIKDKNNLQIQGRAGLGRRREKGREEQRKNLQKRAQQAVALPKVPETKQLSYLDLAKQQEEKAAQASKEEAVQTVQPSESKKGKRKKRKRSAAEPERTEQWERSHVLPKADLHRDDTVHFGAGEAAPEAASAEGQSALPSASAAAAEVGPGCLVVLCDLKAQPELNGNVATLIRWDDAAGRWHAKGQDGEKRLKPENLAVQTLLAQSVPVRLKDLRGAQELNGKQGICRTWNGEKMRWLVAVESHGKVLLKAENLEVALKPGLLVRLFGLKAASLNGAEAVCTALAGERWRVRLGGGEEKALRPTNLRPLPNQEPPALCPAVSQTIKVCKASEVLPQLLQLMREVQESEKKGLRIRSLTLVVCSNADSVAAAAGALAGRQLACTKLSDKAQQERAKREFILDGKRILVAADDALQGLKLPLQVSRLVSLDLCEIEVHRQRLALLDRCGEERGGDYHAFVDDKASTDLARELCKLLRRVKAKVEPALEALAAPKEGQPAAGEAAKDRARRPKRGKVKA